MEDIKQNKFIAALKYILYIIIVLFLTLLIFIVKTFIQGWLFIPDEFIIWVAHATGIGVIYLLEFVMIAFTFKWIKAKPFKGFTIALIIIIYYMLVNVTVIEDNKIIRHGFFTPQGIVYEYSDIEKIETGVYGKKIPFIQSKGEFYYKIKFYDGKEINLTNIGATMNDKDIYITIMEIDKKIKSLGIEKNSDISNFNLCKENLNQIYVDRIGEIIGY